MMKSILFSIFLVLFHFILAHAVLARAEHQLSEGYNITSAPLVSPSEAKAMRKSEKRSLKREKRLSKASTEVSTGSAAITREIQELARGLRNNPQLIYEFVRNNIAYVPMYGSLKGATMTYLDGSGNDFDQTSLLISLMRAAGYTANYVYGTIQLSGEQVNSWLGIENNAELLEELLGSGGIPAAVTSSGDAIDYVIMDHVWAKVTIDGTDYLFDPSYKTCSKVSGIDIGQAIGYDGTAFMTRATQGMTSTADYLQNMNRENIRNDLTSFGTTLISYIKSNMPGAGMDDIIGGCPIDAVRDQTFQTQLSYEYSRYEEWEEIPEQLETLVDLEYWSDTGGFHTYASEIYGKRVTLVLYSPGNGASDYGAFYLDGELISQFELGRYYQLPLTITIDHPYAANEGTYCDQEKEISIGGFLDYGEETRTFYISTGLGTTGRKIIEKHRKTLERLIDEDASSTSEPVLGESLAMIGLSWMAEVSSAAHIIDRISQTVTINHHSFGLVGQNDAPMMDMPMNVVSVVSLNQNSDEKLSSFYSQSGISSALEWGAIDQMQPMSAVSTIKLLDIANATGNKIFDADSANYETDVRPNLLNYSEDDLTGFDDRIAEGQRLILPENGNLQEESWVGYGFLARKPSGGMASLISGGLSGGFGNEYGVLSGYSCLTGQPVLINPHDHAQSDEPIDLVTGHYLDKKTDLTTGQGPLPFGFNFARSYNSGGRHQDGPLGRGWSHNMHITASLASDGFIGLGHRSAGDAAPAIAAFYIVSDLLKDSLALDHLMAATLSHRWCMDHLIDNVVNIKRSGSTYTFRKLPDDTYHPAPGKWAQLTREADDSYLMTTKHGYAFDFNTSGRIESWRDPNGNTVTFGYSSDSLTSVTNTFGKGLALAYNADTRIESVSDHTGRQVTYTYDADGNLASVEDPLGNLSRYEYDLPGRLTKYFKASDSVNPFVTNTYEDPSISYGTSYSTQVTSQLDFGGNNHVYYYAGDRRAEEIDPAGNSRIWEFDAGGRTARFTNPLGFAVDFDYDGLGRLTRLTFPEGNRFENTFDNKDNVTQVSVFPKTGSSEDPIVFSFTYEPNFNHILQRTDPLARETDYHYDAQGNLTELELPTVNTIRPTFDFTVNTRGQVTAVDGPEGMRRTATYNPTTAEMLSSAIDPEGQNITTAYAHDPVGNIVAITDPRGNTSSFEYDDNRRMTKRTSSAPFLYETRFEFDPDGNLTKIRKATGDGGNPWQDFSATYNLGGQRITVTNPLGYETVFQYNNLQSLWKITSNTGQVDEFLYDPQGRPYRRIDPLGHIVEEHVYTDNGMLASLADANGNRTTFQYDDFDRLGKEIFTDGTYREFTYDLAGNVTREITRAGDTISYAYDPLDRRTGKTLPGPAITQYEFDALSRLTRITDASGVITLDYDTANRLLSIVYPDGREVGYAYDVNGNRTGLTYPDGFGLTYSYDVMNRVTEINENSGGTLAQYTYDPLSRITHLLLGNSVATEYTYLPDNRTETARYQFANGAVDFGYSYNELGFLTAKAVSDEAFQYAPPQSSAQDFTANSLNQYSKVNTRTYVYDNNGNLTNDGLNTYHFDPENRLTSMTTSQQTITYTYNALGQRVRKDVDGTAVDFVHDGLHVLAEYDTEGAMTKRFVHGPGLDNPVLMQTAAGKYYYHQDRRRSVVAMSDNSGNRVETYAYSPNGEPSRASSIGNPFMFTGREYEPETGLSYMRTRYYSAGLGRFLSVDPLDIYGGDLNLYTYARNNPLAFLDPLGLCSWDFEIPLMAAVTGSGIASMEGYYSSMTGEIVEVVNMFEGSLRDFAFNADITSTKVNNLPNIDYGGTVEISSAQSEAMALENMSAATAEEAGTNLATGEAVMTGITELTGPECVTCVIPIIMPTSVIEEFVEMMLYGTTNETI